MMYLVNANGSMKVISVRCQIYGGDRDSYKRITSDQVNKKDNADRYSLTDVYT